MADRRYCVHRRGAMRSMQPPPFVPPVRRAPRGIFARLVAAITRSC